MGAPADSEPSLEGPEPDLDIAADIGVDIAADIAAPAPTAGLGPGQRRSVAGRYLLLEHIAEGGMGSVYVAEHALSKKKLALKLVHPYLCRGRQGVERFRREVSAAAEIDHPGIVQVYDAGTDDDGGFFMAMELLEGESLGDRLRRSWPGMKSAVALVDGMLEPLAKAHAKGFVHRDLKPDNIFLAVLDEGGERVKLLDFGLAREVDKSGATRTGITFGTPEYMSPEQAMSARKVRAPGDVWSVGVMLYELLSGDHPFTGETPNAIMANAIKEPLPSLRERAPHVPLPLARVIERALEKEPKARPQSAGELLEELRAAVAECGELDETVPVAPNPPGAWSSSEEGAVSSSYPVQRQPQAKLPTHVVADGDSQPETKRRRNPALFVIGGAVAMGLLLIVGSLAYRLLGAPDADAATAVSAEGARLEPPPAPPESPSESPSESAAAERPAREAELALPPAAEEPPEEVAEEAEVTQEEAAVEARPGRRAAPAARRAPRPSALEAAQVCLAEGDRECARQALAGRARTAPEMALLIRLSRDTGHGGEAVQLMRQFVERWPDAPQTPGYRQDLGLR